MGQQESVQLVDEDTPPQRLKKRDIESVAKYINDGKAKRIVVMVCTPSRTSNRS
jgi:NAD-dependent histone deacetylase SIR2